MSQLDHWLPQQMRNQGLEIDAEGYPVLSVYFYGSVPENVITEIIPQDLNYPRWNGKDWENGERAAGIFRAGKDLSKNDRKA